MDSTLLDQIRHLCRDRAAYERLKAILVQQERVHQLSWQERYDKLMSAQSEEAQAVNTFSNIIAREKALAQLADAIQRSPSLELVLQVAVQVAQKLLQVDRVAIFHRHSDGRGEFTTDAIASGISSIADMPERQLLLAKHMVDSMQSEQSFQTVESIRSSSFSSHIVTLLEQISISSYAANQIYAGQEAWGTLVAFHGSAYHTWSESDRTSLALVAAQIGIAISLANMRQQSQILADDLQALQTELDSLQETVNEIIESKSKIETPDHELAEANEPIITMFSQNIVEEEIDQGTTASDVDLEEIADQEDAEFIESQEIEDNLDDEVTDSDYSAISQNGVPRLFLIPDLAPSSDQTSNLDTDSPAENTNSVMEEKSDEDEEIVNPESVEEINTDAEHLADIQADIDEANIENNTDDLSSESISEIESLISEDVNIIATDVEVSVSEDVNIIAPDVSEDEVAESPLSEDTDIEVEITATTEPDIAEPIDESPPSEADTDEQIDESPQSEVAVSESSDLANVANVEQIEEIPDPLVDSPVEAQATSQLSEPENTDLENSPQEAIALSSSELETIIITPPFLEVSESPSESLLEANSSELENPDLANPAPDQSPSKESEPPLDHELPHLGVESLVGAEIENSEPEMRALSVVSPSSDSEMHEDTDLQLDTDLQVFIEPTDDDTQQDDTSQTGIEEVDHQAYDEDRDPPIEPQFIETILSIAGHDEKGIKFLLDVIDTYLEETPRLVQAIDKSLSFSDHPRLLQSLNTLRSSSEYVGALALAYQCRQLESAVRANYVVLIYACLSQVAIEAQRATEALRIERSRYVE